MIGLILELLPLVDANTEAIQIAKGKHELPKLKGLLEKIRQVWHRKK